MSDEYCPQSTLLLVVGAQEFPRANLTSSKAFFNAVTSLTTYFTSDAGFRLPLENLFSFFDSNYDPNTLDDQITTRIRTRIQQLNASGQRAKDLIVYYVGHGSFDEQKRYYLAIRSTREENQSISSLRMDSFDVTLSNLGQELRKYIIIDACFSGEAAAYTQSSIETAVEQHLRRLPTRGTTFLCSSSRDIVSEFLPDESNTVFTEALTEVLWNGSSEYPARLSLEDLQTLVEEKLANTSNQFIRPEIHTPVQPQGSVAKVALFPNGPRRTALEQELVAREAAVRNYLRGQAEEQARHAEKLKLERHAQEEDVRRRLLAEQERERAREEEGLRYYSSEAEKAFREEAELVRSGEPDIELLTAWLGWKAQDLRIQAGALRQRASDQKSEAATKRYSASNVWDHLSKEQKSGSVSTVLELREHWYELIGKAEAEERSAAALMDQAEDADLSSQYYSSIVSDAASVTASTALARSSGRSFQDSVEYGLVPIIRRAQRKRRVRRFLAASWKWTRRITITILIIILLGICAELRSF